MTREYTVKPGDTLATIARRFLGSAGKWSVLAEVNAIADPDRIQVGQRLKIPVTETAEAPKVLDPVAPPTEKPVEAVTFSEEGKNVFATLPTGEKVLLGKRFKKGIFRGGRHQPEDFLRAETALLAELALSPSEIQVMLGTAENEGNLDAVNTWDNAFLSFGIFQWTSGTGDDPGELPKLLSRIKALEPETFRNYWGQFGLDVADVGRTTGRFTLGGVRLATGDDKEALRQLAWVLRFARAGADRKVEAIEILHAIARLDGFFPAPEERLGGRSLSQLITSEYGAALLLDNHVNRPGYVVGCVVRALEGLGMTAGDAAAADDATERRLLERYLEVRETFGRHPMTHARQRAEVTRKYLRDGLISDRRGSFKSNRDAR